MGTGEPSRHLMVFVLSPQRSLVVQWVNLADVNLHGDLE
jgi:hypothetical protein